MSNTQEQMHVTAQG